MVALAKIPTAAFSLRVIGLPFYTVYWLFGPLTIRKHYEFLLGIVFGWVAVLTPLYVIYYPSPMMYAENVFRYKVAFVIILVFVNLAVHLEAKKAKILEAAE